MTGSFSPLAFTRTNGIPSFQRNGTSSRRSRKREGGPPCPWTKGARIF
nr:MAG TPA: hypothetical protein [Caudoviricetes sp.]